MLSTLPALLATAEARAFPACIWMFTFLGAIPIPMGAELMEFDGVELPKS
jgi:hypothetical protein